MAGVVVALVAIISGHGGTGCPVSLVIEEPVLALSPGLDPKVGFINRLWGPGLRLAALLG